MHDGDERAVHHRSMDLWDAEGHARAIYERAGCDAANPPTMIGLARSLFGRHAVKRHRPFGTLAACVTNPSTGDVTIFVAPKLPPNRVNFPVAHEIVEWWLRREQHELIELAVDQAAAALMAPRQAFLPLYRELGPSGLADLAETFGTSESMIAMRIGEAAGTPLALVGPTFVRTRGDAWVWPPDAEVRRLAKARSAPPEICRINLADDRRRTLLLAAE